MTAEESGPERGSDSDSGDGTSGVETSGGGNAEDEEAEADSSGASGREDGVILSETGVFEEGEIAEEEDAEIGASAGGTEEPEASFS